MLKSILLTFIYLTLVLITFFFILGNVSLMRLKKDVNIKTEYAIGQLPDEERQNDQGVIDELEKHEHLVNKETERECLSAKHQIMKNYMMKQNKDKRQTDSLIPGLSKELAPVSDEQPLAPLLENFEDYAPIDTPVNIPKDKGTIHLNKKNTDIPNAVNEHDTQHLSKFDSEYRVPWNGKRGVDDLSYFFDTHKFDVSFDQSKKNPVMCPSDWEKKTKK